MKRALRHDPGRQTDRLVIIMETNTVRRIFFLVRKGDTPGQLGGQLGHLGAGGVIAYRSRPSARAQRRNSEVWASFPPRPSQRSSYRGHFFSLVQQENGAVVPAPLRRTSDEATENERCAGREVGSVAGHHKENESLTVSRPGRSLEAAADWSRAGARTCGRTQRSRAPTRTASLAIPRLYTTART